MSKKRFKMIQIKVTLFFLMRVIFSHYVSSSRCDYQPGMSNNNGLHDRLQTQKLSVTHKNNN